MRKSFTILLAASLVTGALLAPTADAAKKKKKKAKKVTRAASAEYTGHLAGFGSAQAGGNNIGGVLDIPTGANEEWVMIKIVDATGTAVPGTLTQDIDGDGSSPEAGEPGTDFCSATDKPVKILKGYTVNVYVGAGPCGSAAGTGTKGTVEFVFSNLP